ncbi:RidA family protein, partial [Clostridioides difficile]
MEIKRYEGTGRMSRAVVHNNTVYLCGQTHAEGGVIEQTTEVLAKIED